MAYPFGEIEARWQEYWRTNKTFATDTTRADRPKYYVLSMYPYPSGEGLHIGHPESYTAVDIIGRYKRHRGYEVLNPMGWDAFGLPAEQYAMKTGVHPRETTRANIVTFRRQLQAIGFAFDWDREVDTSDPAYYKWTQWIFLKLYNAWFDPRIGKGRHIDELKKELAASGTSGLPAPPRYDGPEWNFSADDWNAMSALERQNVLKNFRLVYEDESPVNWCADLGTVLANEEVDEWVEKGYTVERRPIRQWMMRITAYADRFADGHDMLDWPASTVDMQRNWIGKSYGAEVRFLVDAAPHEIRVFTTRPDTIYGATFLTVAPEHPLVDDLTTNAQRAEVEAYKHETALKSDLDRQAGTEKTGVFTGSYAINPATKEPIPIWIADYVLAGYGTGAIMGVPGQDERDWEFAERFSLPIVRTVQPPDDFEGGAYTGDGPAINSGILDGLTIADAKARIIEWLEENGIGTARVNYKLRDWLFSRQRYWGEPIPLVHYENGIVEPVDESALPLELPELSEFKPSGSTESPLALVPDWVNVEHPVHGRGRRETNTMPQWAGSCWYYIRYLDPHNGERLIDPAIEQRWLPVDFYIGGAEHVVTHLLYSRFWHQALYDLGHLSSPEPFTRLIHQGMILGENAQKMSKSRGNVVNPDVVIGEYGADALRLFEMFMGPFEADKPWSSTGIEGIRRFLNRAWMMMTGDLKSAAVIVDRAMTPQEERVLHATIRKVTEDIEAIRFNTAISAMMVFVNEFLGAATKPVAAMRAFAILLSPFAPHMAEELWRMLGNTASIADAAWPEHDPEKIREEEIEIVLQVNSKIKDRLTVPVGSSAEELETLALAHEGVQAMLNEKSVRKVIAVPDRLVNVIIG